MTKATGVLEVLKVCNSVIQSFIERGNVFALGIVEENLFIPVAIAKGIKSLGTDSPTPRSSDLWFNGVVCLGGTPHKLSYDFIIN